MQVQPLKPFGEACAEVAVLEYSPNRFFTVRKGFSYSSHIPRREGSH